MNTTTTTPEAPNGPETDQHDDQAPEGTTTDQETAEGDHGGDDQEGEEQDNPGREAARYRRQLRDTEAERDTLTAQVDAMRRAEVERIAASTVQNPRALWSAGTEVDDLLTAEGTVDPDKVKNATIAAAELLGLARPRPGNHVPKEGSNPRPPSSSSSWEGAFKP